ncbi:PLDc N-terminal domain-containing protein [Arthrobacter sp. NicSoilB8]|uniref:PLDc N-terminal domain-containing protein n=1 Tax=Arthrobacter sp. NicSoilB8 TaxID=2830998 RepID=UPI001CC3D671|nr:PLDc N-terminal domain-containing protein [Arthrobacter sp. NicSoilB8]BCW71346.1 membrane protein [Arthrobacter sp. NicSoilB8]
MGFWDFIWLMFSFVMFVAYLMVLFLVFRDIFSDSLRPGWVKALWVLAVLLFPLLGCLAYMLFYGQQMTIRQSARQDVARDDMADYIRRTANANPADQIAAAKKLLDEGTITGEEFQMLKARALG